MSGTACLCRLGSTQSRTWRLLDSEPPQGRRSCPHRLVPAASSSEPPTSVGLACRPVGAWRRHLVKRIQSTGDSRHIAKQFRPRPRRRLPTCHYDDCGREAAVPGLLVRHRLRPRRGGRGTRRGGGADPTRSINGLLRQYFPQGTDLSVHSAEYLAEVAAELDNRPRKRCDFDSPAQVLNRLLSQPPQVTVASEP